ncbi:2,4-dihydroxyhept-2-ene-1,7-dioic acid aldolase [Marinibacterium profundimaris]|uniref:2,4-dihydroxyhept-2-ene-1,7-dioic acid aldolase n=2 Tax=Marinibacterium profundimaris TaxID=1679460 RepID=A0A225NFM8_9RHOB|nr:2,4-dihydroxyhept-2-ene-1,7-dioic acid aldolase [Marinibacterium profundimaris]
MIKDTGTFATPNASKYLQQLCKHFGHKVEARCDETSGEVALGTGPAVMAAEPELLTIVVHAPDADGLAVARDVIDRHLERFAFREEFANMDWQGA